jgi:hypothetical protein
MRMGVRREKWIAIGGPGGHGSGENDMSVHIVTPPSVALSFYWSCLVLSLLTRRVSARLSRVSESFRPPHPFPRHPPEKNVQYPSQNLLNFWNSRLSLGASAWPNSGACSCQGRPDIGDDLVITAPAPGICLTLPNHHQSHLSRSGDAVHPGTFLNESLSLPNPMANLRACLPTFVR